MWPLVLVLHVWSTQLTSTCIVQLLACIFSGRCGGFLGHLAIVKRACDTSTQLLLQSSVGFFHQMTQDGLSCGRRARLALSSLAGRSVIFLTAEGGRTSRGLSLLALLAIESEHPTQQACCKTTPDRQQFTCGEISKGKRKRPLDYCCSSSAFHPS